MRKSHCSNCCRNRLLQMQIFIWFHHPLSATTTANNAPVLVTIAIPLMPNIFYDSTVKLLGIQCLLKTVLIDVARCTHIGWNGSTPQHNKTRQNGICVHKATNRTLKSLIATCTCHIPMLALTIKELSHEMLNQIKTACSELSSTNNVLEYHLQTHRWWYLMWVFFQNYSS